MWNNCLTKLKNCIVSQSQTRNSIRHAMIEWIWAFDSANSLAAMVYFLNRVICLYSLLRHSTVIIGYRINPDQSDILSNCLNLRNYNSLGPSPKELDHMVSLMNQLLDLWYCGLYISREYVLSHMPPSPCPQNVVDFIVAEDMYFPLYFSSQSNPILVPSYHHHQLHHLIIIIIGQFIERRTRAEVITRALNTKNCNSIQISRPIEDYLYWYDLENTLRIITSNSQDTS